MTISADGITYKCDDGACGTVHTKSNPRTSALKRPIQQLNVTNPPPKVRSVFLPDEPEKAINEPIKRSEFLLDEIIIVPKFEI